MPVNGLIIAIMSLFQLLVFLSHSLHPTLYPHPRIKLQHTLPRTSYPELAYWSSGPDSRYQQDAHSTVQAARGDVYIVFVYS